MWLQPHHQIKHTNVFYEGSQGQTKRAVVLWEEEECILRSGQRGSLYSFQHLLTVLQKPLAPSLLAEILDLYIRFLVV